jgi:ribokinase
LVYENGVSNRVPPATNNLVDATGAGDSFAGAFLAHYLNGAPALEAAHFATTISAWVIEQLGARPEPDARMHAILHG